jgi:hypothetical protein
MNKGREELRKFNAEKEHSAAINKAMDDGKEIPTRVLADSPEHYKRAVETYQPTSGPVGFGDLVQTKDGKRGIMHGGDPTLGAGNRVRVSDPFNEKSGTFENRSELVKLIPAQSNPADATISK